MKQFVIPKTGEMVHLRRGDVLWCGKPKVVCVDIVKEGEVGIAVGNHAAQKFGWMWSLLLVSGRGFRRHLIRTEALPEPVYFSPGVCLDQTIGYYDANGNWTTKYDKAMVYRHAANVLNYPHDFVEIIWDLDEWRRQDPTW